MINILHDHNRGHVRPLDQRPPFPTNSPSCGNQPAHISLTARRTWHTNQERQRRSEEERAGLHAPSGETGRPMPT
jgi:hypothetical protein